MKILDRSFASAEENLSCDEALLELSEEGAGCEVLRFWEPARHFVVLGYSNSWEKELRFDVLNKKNPPVFRRVSGGGTVLQGPGCLNYALVLKIDGRPPLGGIVSANRMILEKNRAALQNLLGKKVEVRGSTDLALGNLKFSGNSQRRKLRHLLFHGTFLLDMDLSRMEEWLALPERQPAYRKKRAHGRFVMNLGVPAGAVKQALARAWDADGQTDAPLDKMETLVRERYSRPEWNFKF